MTLKKIYIFALMLTFTGCFQDEEYDTQLVLRPTYQEASGDDFLSYTGCVGYAFDADTALWEILNIEDAVAGVMSLKEDNEVKKYPIYTAQSHEEEGLDEGSMLSMRIKTTRPLILVANEVGGTYAYRYYSIGLNISKIYLYSLFRLWKTEDYTENSWEYIITTPEIE